MKRVFAVIVICIMLTGCISQPAAVQDNEAGENQPGPSVTIQPAESDYTDSDKLSGLFGFTNEAGSLLLIPSLGLEAEDVTAVNKAIGENGNVLTVKYLKEQEGNERDNGRFTAQNFDNIKGHIFEILQGAARGNETYYLVNGSEFNIGAVLESGEGSHKRIDEASKEEIERIKNRKLKDSWEIGIIKPDISLYLLLFEREGDSMLAGIVMKTPERMVFKDYPAKYDQFSTWRVDDGGAVYPEMFRILFAAKAESGILLGLKWSAFEGESTVLLMEKDGIFEDMDIEAFRYMSPI